MFSAHFAQLKWENHHPPPQNFLELLRILPSIQRSAFLADSMRVSTKSESECLTPPAGLKGEVYSEIKLSQSVELFLTKRMPPIRNPSDVWFSSYASWKSAATPPQFGRNTPFWRHWHSDWLARDREKVVFRTFRKIWAFSSRFVPRGIFRTILRV